MCPSRFSAEELRAKRDSSEEGGLLFAALYQQEPMPEDGAVFKAENVTAQLFASEERLSRMITDFIHDPPEF